MAGHSHWARIKRAKAANDAKRGRIWSKISRKIIVASRAGGPNPEDNLALRYAIDEGKEANMPSDTIDRAIKKGAGELDGESYEQVIYEGYGPGGVAFMVDCLTDNRNRTAPEMRKIFEKSGGQLGSTGCVAWMFQSKGSFAIATDATDEDTLMELALEAGAEDVAVEEDGFLVTCEVGNYSDVKQALADAGIEVLSSELGMIPANRVEVPADKAAAVVRLMSELEDHDDVQNVYANFDIPEDVLQQVAGE
jgi:YebC/PmpR family DNA-binding regulatory protein